MNRKTVALLSITAVLGLTLSGCVAALIVGGAAGVGGALYAKGDLESTVDYSYDQVWEASLKGLDRARQST